MELLDFLKSLRKVIPAIEKIYLIWDNFSPHVHKSIRQWAKANRLVLVFTPTNDSWLNRIECHFAPLREFVLSNSNYQSHQELAHAIRGHIRWRNRCPNNAEIIRLQKRVQVA